MKTILVDAVWAFIYPDEGLDKKMYELLETFPNRKIVLTGANDEEYKEFGLEAVPYELFTLKHNPNKSDPEYYKKMLAHFNLTKDDVVYFEHNQEAMKSAQSAGILTHFYDSEKRDLDSLKKFLEENA